MTEEGYWAYLRAGGLRLLRPTSDGKAMVYANIKTGEPVIVTNPDFFNEEERKQEAERLVRAFGVDAPDG